MRIVTDASALVAELLRARGRALLTHPEVAWSASEEVASEVRHELIRRTGALVRRRGLTANEGAALAHGATEFFTSVVAVVPRSAYEPFEIEARGRLIDQQDWSSVALALMQGASIWSEDRDFCGIGLPVWHTRVLLVHFGLAN